MRVYHARGDITEVALVAKASEQLTQLQSLVGGWIEVVPGSGGHAYCNEEGRLLDLPLNVRASTRFHQWLVGDVVELSPAEFASVNRETYES